MNINMNIILYNPAHNGDHFFTLGIVTKLINDNLDKKFIIVPSCSNFLYENLLSDRVSIEQHPVIWNITKNVSNNNNNFISENGETLWKFHENNIYINLWQLLISDNYCISLVNRPMFVKNTLDEINRDTGIQINFNCNNYKELIPILPYVDIDFILNKIKSYNKKLIFFYNQISCSGFDLSYSNDVNEKIIRKLIDNYGEDHIIILTKPCDISHENLINVETEFGNLPSLDGKNLVINANIANICNHVYFKNNGGSLFVLNQLNIANSNQTEYNFFGDKRFYDVIKNEYGLDCNEEFI